MANEAGWLYTPGDERERVRSARERSLSSLPVIELRPLTRAISGAPDVEYSQLRNWWRVERTPIFRCSIPRNERDGVQLQVAKVRSSRLQGVA